ncbi:MAG: pilus (MSHA type) biogenesis protein MshL [Sulfuricaulis sp.]|uniref:pilus (MSHA type) biogenesis protein MshL n=1 Tax=Sulfuricaulis sp. TaxID=2003553 RepID=UPI0025FF3A19|nr:pilus (MSHA type) biogenesis protein MshL [Sulfuricaulis sp.]MCR4346842.1 pilus (MSHA type) biogenesis protein MshL [Sulfuricaulis sp.]
MRSTDNIGMSIRRTLVVLLGMLLVGCQSVSPGWRDSVSASVDESLTQARAGKDGKAIPPDVSSALLPPMEITLPQGGTAPLEARFDLTVNNAPARQVFMGLVEGTPYSMILHPEVSGTISLNIKEATVPEALNVIRQVYGYEYRRENNRFFILGSDMQTRMFPVNYLNLSRKGMSDTRVSASGLNATGGTTGSSGATTTGTSSSGVQIQTQTLSDFWKDLTTSLLAIVGGEGGRKVVVNPQAGVVLVRAMPDELRLVEEYLGMTQTSMNRQVILEAKIVEVQLKDGFQSGINWAGIASKNGKSVTVGQVGGGSSVSSSTGLSSIAGNTGNLNPTTGIFSAISGTNSSAFGGVFTLAVQANNFAAFFELLKTQGDLNVLSSPRVSTMNNQKAVIKVGTDSYFVTKQDSTASTVSGGSPTISTELSPFFSGIALDVTPQIDEAGNINLHIHPSVSEVSEKQITVASSQTVSTALSSVQESDNIVRATSGQIIVIGGLMKEASTEDNISVPLLGDIPLIGNLFKHKKVTRIKRELVILLKPTIINDGQDWNDATGESQERIRKIRIGS